MLLQSKCGTCYCQYCTYTTHCCEQVRHPAAVQKKWTHVAGVAGEGGEFLKVWCTDTQIYMLYVFETCENKQIQLRTYQLRHLQFHDSTLYFTSHLKCSKKLNGYQNNRDIYCISYWKFAEQDTCCYIHKFISGSLDLVNLKKMPQIFNFSKFLFFFFTE